MRIKGWSLDMVNRCRGKAGLAVAALVLLVVSVSVASAQAGNPWFGNPLFTQQDAVQAFDLVTGSGYQIGTATAKISGTTFVEFQFAPTGPPVGDVLPISFQNKVIITDIDGDQIFFDNNGTGSFHLAVPGADFKGSGGTGTYVVTGGTGKYQSWTVGSTYRYRAIFTSPPTPPSALGNVYVEIFRNYRHR
jgi:hypothetical protein